MTGDEAEQIARKAREDARWEARVEALEKENAELNNRVDAMEARWNDYVRKGVLAILLAAFAVLWEPFAKFWASVTGKGP